MEEKTWNLRFAALIFCALAVFSAFILSTALSINGTTYYTLFDDAMISMRYARNFAEGMGLVWNPNEPAVEGYTNFLWTIIMALLHLLPIHEGKVPLAVMMLCALILLANIMIFKGIASSVLKKKAPHFAEPVIWASALYYPLIFWTLRGLEVGLLTVIFNSMLLLSLKNQEESGLNLRALTAFLGVLAVLTRTDAIIPVAVILAAGGGYLIVLPVAALILHTLFRWVYYGDILPNTWYLKMYGIPPGERIDRGLESVSSLFLEPLLVPALLAAVWLVYFLRQKDAQACERRIELLLFLLFLSQCAYSVYVGGDVWDGWGISGRFITPAIPYLYILAALGLSNLHIPAISPKIAAFVLFLMLWLPSSLWPFGSWIDHGAMYVENYDWPRIRLGLLLREVTSESAVIATYGAGTLPYFAQRQAVDLLGKCDRVVAKSAPRAGFIPGHNKWNYEWSIGELKPDVITDLWNPAEEDLAYIRNRGYTMLPNGIFVRTGSPLVNRERLSMERQDNKHQQVPHEMAHDID